MQDIIDQMKKLYEPQPIPGGTTTNIGETALLAKLMVQALERLRVSRPALPIIPPTQEMLDDVVLSQHADTPKEYEFHFPDGTVIARPVQGGLPELAKEAFRVWKEKADTPMVIEGKSNG